MKVSPFICSAVLVTLLLVSCKSIDAASSASTTPQKAEKPAPRVVEIKTWKIESSRVSYPDGIVSASSSIKYDDAGMIVSDEQYDGKNNLVSKKTYTWEPGKNASIVTQNAAGEVIGKTLCEYKGDILLKETLSNPNGDVQSTSEYRYDASGNRTGLTVKTATGGTVSTEYVRVNGIITTIQVLDASGAVIKRFERTYGDGNMLAREDESDAGGIIRSSVVYGYANGFLAHEENRNATGSVQSRIEYVNDTNGNPVEIRYLDRNGRLIEVKKQQWKVFTRTITEE